MKLSLRVLPYALLLSWLIPLAPAAAQNTALSNPPLSKVVGSPPLGTRVQAAAATEAADQAGDEKDTRVKANVKADVKPGEKPGAEKPAPKLPNVDKIFAGGVPQTLEELRAMEKRHTELAKKLVPITVGVQIGMAQGSGVIISSDGYVLTAAHVSGKADQNVRFILHDGRMVRGKSLGLNRSLDAGLLKINTIIRDGKEIEWPHADVGLSGELKVGQWVFATGHPGGYKRGRPPVVRVGRLVATRSNLLVSDCKLVGGDSGGPLFSMDGKVIGIHSRIGSSLATNMHVPVDTYMSAWDRLAKGEEWGSQPGARPVIGVRGDPDSAKAKLAEVLRGSPAAQAGLKKGDIVLRFDGKEVSDFASLKGMVAGKKPGDKVKVQVKRGGKTEELELVIGKVGGRWVVVFSDCFR